MNSGILTLQQAILRFRPGTRNPPPNPGPAQDAAAQQPGQRAISPGAHTVVFTNGCFDLLHPGHIRTLEAARKLGDALVVGLNSDRGVRELKGAGRPVQPEQERAEILAALECVDAVVIFDEPTPREIIAALLPDVLVKGGDWASDQIVGRQEVEAAGGRVVSIDIAPGYSTTAILQKIRATAPESAPESAPVKAHDETPSKPLSVGAARSES